MRSHSMGISSRKLLVMLVAGAVCLLAIEVGYSLELERYALRDDGAGFFRGPVTVTVSQLLRLGGGTHVAQGSAGAKKAP